MARAGREPVFDVEHSNACWCGFTRFPSTAYRLVTTLRAVLTN